MSDEDDTEEEEAPLVELGDRTPVEGAPLARVASRLYWPVQRSEIRRKEGETVVRTAEGPTSVDELLDGTDITYFESRQEFVDACREVTGTGPVPTAE
ncbi:hypothetical protein HAPAU_03710 [Halalkalicoccus paucihalophilus]|uniref:Uncharacterized protein n=1 Tax=Halalkalicoccus paucihalophilus TaxID=1008153 RepID=A0A151AJ97_9EURY|nr:DUF5789 family protein [Halalkalicoccus paucihalophilus]KYH27703.1 hypothetical protein HAPAU_03710 [Halalkalicoccus paucihalophilus]